MLERTSQFLGKCPDYIPEYDLLDYFIYIYEYAWSYMSFDNYKDDIKGHFKSQLEQLIVKRPQLSNEKKWWALVLFAIKDVTIADEYSFAKETINYLISKIDFLSVDELRIYANSLNGALNCEMSDIITIRPIEILRMHSDAFEEDSAIRYFMERKDEFLKVFKSQLVQKDMSSKYMEQFSLKKRPQKFCEYWDIYFEIFVGFFISMLGYIEIFPSKSKLEQKNYFKEIIQKITSVYFIGSITTKPKIEIIINKTIPLIIPYMIKHFTLKE